MNITAKLNEPSRQIRIVALDGAPWFLGEDVARVLGAEHVEQLHAEIAASGGAHCRMLRRGGRDLCLISPEGLGEKLVRICQAQGNIFGMAALCDLLADHPDVVEAIAPDLRRLRDTAGLADGGVKLAELLRLAANAAMLEAEASHLAAEAGSLAKELRGPRAPAGAAGARRYRN
jgi:hypothetical protein